MSSTPHHASIAAGRDRAGRLAGVRGVGVRGGMRGGGASRLRGAGVRGGIRGAGVAALAATAGLVLSACSGGEEPAAMPSSASSGVTSSSSSSPAPSTPPAPADEPVPAVTAPAALGATHAPAPTTDELPALVVATGGPCQTIGEVAQALDGSPLFCLNDSDAGPLWLPQPEAGPDATGPALRHQPCAHEGLTVDAPDGTALTCTLTGDGSMPGGLLWQ